MTSVDPSHGTDRDSGRVEVALSTEKISLLPGQAGPVTVTVTNRSSVVEQYTLRVEGIDVGWYTVGPEEIKLFPDATGGFDLDLLLPETPVAVAGLYRVRLTVEPTSAPDDAATVAVDVEVVPVGTLELALVPSRVKTRERARMQVRLSNATNAGFTVDLAISDAEDALQAVFSADRVALQAGQRHEETCTLSLRRRRSGPPPHFHAFTLTATQANVALAEPLATVIGEVIFEGKAPFLFGWPGQVRGLVVRLMPLALIAALVVGAAAWVLATPGAQAPLRRLVGLGAAPGVPESGLPEAGGNSPSASGAGGTGAPNPAGGSGAAGPPAETPATGASGQSSAGATAVAGVSPFGSPSAAQATVPAAGTPGPLGAVASAPAAGAGQAAPATPPAGGTPGTGPRPGTPVAAAGGVASGGTSGGTSGQSSAGGSGGQPAQPGGTVARNVTLQPTPCVVPTPTALALTVAAPLPPVVAGGGAQRLEQLPRPNVIWTGKGEPSNWADPKNWSSETVPGEGDYVELSGVAKHDGPIKVRGLTLDGTLQATQLTVADAFVWLGGQLIGTDATVPAGGALWVVGPEWKFLTKPNLMHDAGSLKVAGNAFLGGPGGLRLGGGVVFENTGTLTVDAPITLDVGSIGGTNVFSSSGTLIVAAPPSAAGGASLLVNGPNARLQGPTILEGPAILTLYGGQHTLAAGTRLGGTGRVRAQGGQVTLEGAATIESGATFELAPGGRLIGAGAFVGGGTFAWTGGTVGGARTDVVVGRDTTLRVSGPEWKYLTRTDAVPGNTCAGQAATLTSMGSAFLGGPGGLRLSGGAVLENAGTLTVDAPVAIDVGDNAGTNTFGSSGTLVVAAPAPASGGATLVVNGPNARLHGPVMTDGLAILALYGGQHSLAAGTRLGGTGRVRAQGGQVTLDGTATLERGATFEIAPGGQLVGTGALGGGGTFAWTGGTIGGARTDVVVGRDTTLRVSGPEWKYLKRTDPVAAEGRLRVEGNAFLGGPGGLRLSGGAVLENAGTLTVDAPMTLDVGDNAGTNTFGSSGTLVVTAPAPASGGATLVVNGPNARLQGPVTVERQAVFSLYGGQHVLRAGTRLGGAGRLRAQGGQVALEGAVALEGGGTFELASGGRLLGTGTMGGTGTFAWTGGSIDSDTIALQSTSTFHITGVDDGPLPRADRRTNSGRPPRPVPTPTRRP